MKAFLQKMGRRQMDEMERGIQLRSVRIAYYAMLAALFLWSIIGNSHAIVEQTGEVVMLPNLIMLLAVFTQSISVLVLRRRATADDEEYSGTEYPIWKILLIICVLTAVFTSIASALIFYFVGMR